MNSDDVIGLGIKELCRESHATAVEKGWWENRERNFGEQIALMHSELSEALEEFRKYGMNPDWFLYDEVESTTGPSLVLPDGSDGNSHKPMLHGDGRYKAEGIAAEFADVLIRIADTCERYDIPLAQALRIKMAYNKKRPYRHGGKRA